MKAIITTYHGPTNTKGSRISADDGDGNRVTISVNGSLNFDLNHAEAVKALCKKMNWSGKLQAGATRQGMAWTWIDPRQQIVVK